MNAQSVEEIAVLSVHRAAKSGDRCACADALANLGALQRKRLRSAASGAWCPDAWGAKGNDEMEGAVLVSAAEEHLALNWAHAGRQHLVSVCCCRTWREQCCCKHRDQNDRAAGSSWGCGV